MQEVFTHQVNEANRALRIVATDELGPGGAHHAYEITGGAAVPTFLRFQNGAIKEAGVNGITHEALIAVIIDRLEAFQAGPYRCRENALAITKLEEAAQWLGHRTAMRERRGVEGKKVTVPGTYKRVGTTRVKELSHAMDSGLSAQQDQKSTEREVQKAMGKRG